VLRPEATHRSRPREATLVRRISRALDKKTSLRPPHRVCAPRNDQKAANPAKPARGACNPHALMDSLGMQLRPRSRGCVFSVP
jgi:hypothetical protein